MAPERVFPERVFPERVNFFSREGYTPSLYARVYRAGP